MRNYGDVLNQLVGHGLRVSHLEVGHLVRCKVENEREKKGWYAIHEMPVTGGDVLLVGSYGIWRGDDQGTQKITLDKSDSLSKEQNEVLRKRILADKKKADAFRKKRASTAARKAESAWGKSSESGDHEYLERKSIQGYGVRFTEKGAMAIPMLDTSGKIHGLQLILDRNKHKEQLKNNGRDKHYWPPGVIKKAHFHLIGSPVDILLIAEGYATAASLYAATGLPVVVAFDANNLMPVTQALKKRYPTVKIIICADDDAFSKCLHCKKPVNVNKSNLCTHCEKPHGKKNTGVEAASLVALKYGCYWVKPEFNDPDAIYQHFCKNKGKLTDFNDLQVTDGLHAVRTQIDKVIDSNNLREELRKRAERQQTEGNSGDIISSTDQAIERFSLIKGANGTVFDKKDHMRMAKSDMFDLFLRRDIRQGWQESPLREIVSQENVSFDPTGKDKNIILNTFSGWPTKPKKGQCDGLLDLLEYMCSYEKEKTTELYEWVLKWLAYPLQHPGTKLSTSIVIHGGQGAGKNLFFEAVMGIYGKYGQIIDQPAIEDKFNDWASSKLFMIADEVVARTELHHIKNRLKGYITGQYIRINPKNMGAYQERNHMNFVFLSNEIMPTVLDPDDRRHAVFWTPEKLSAEFYQDVASELNNGGIAALHDYLLNLPLGDFNPHSKPPMTKAKADLIELSKPSPIQFYDDWTNGNIEGFEKPVSPIRTQHLYDLYRAWCPSNGCRAIDQKKLVGIVSKQPGVFKQTKSYIKGSKRASHVFITPPEALEVNPGSSVEMFYGDCANNFSNRLDLYKAQC